MLNTTTFPTPLFDVPLRSQMELLRRMMQLRWSSGSYLDALVGNYGVSRPPLGFRDDDVFRSIAQTLMMSEKAHLKSITDIMDTLFGPYEPLVFELPDGAATGDSYLTVARDTRYAAWSAWNAVAFTPGEVLAAVGTGVTARFLYLDTDTDTERIHFAPPATGTFAVGDVINGLSSGGQVTLSTAMMRHVSDTDTSVSARCPLYGRGVLSRGLPAEEAVIFVSPSPYLHRVRVVTPLANTHAAGAVLWIQGWNYEIYQSASRRVAIKLLRDRSSIARIPGLSYLHRSATRSAYLAAPAVGGSNVLSLDISVLDGIPAPPFPVVIDPEEQYKPLHYETVIGYVPATRVATLAAVLPAGSHYRAGTEVRWVQTNVVAGGLTANTVIGDTSLSLSAVYTQAEMIGHWILNEGGGNEELVFVTATTYQKRLVMSEIIAGVSTEFAIDAPLDGYTDGQVVNIWARVSDTTGVLGILNAVGVRHYADGDSARLYPRLILVGAAGFGTAIALRPTYIEIFVDAAANSTWTLSRPMSIAHAIGESVQQWLGTPTTIVTPADYTPEAGWPTTAFPEGKWPGPYCFDMHRRSPVHMRANGTSVRIFGTVAVDDVNDCRIYIARQRLSRNLNPATAPSTFGTLVIWIGGVAYTYRTYDVLVDDASFFPTSAQVQAWRYSPKNPHPLLPPRVVIGQEGRWGGEPIYYWGRGTTGTAAGNTIYLSSGRLRHDAGTYIQTYHEQLPIGSAVGVVGTVDGLPLTEGAILLDHSNHTQEDVLYDSVQKQSDTRALLHFNRPWLPQHSHNPFATSNIDGSPVGVSWIPTDRLISAAYPRNDGYSFPLQSEGDTHLFRLAYAVEMARAAGVQVAIYDWQDRPVSIPASHLLSDVGR